MSADRMNLVEATESAARAAKLLPTVGSEDRRDLLVAPDLEVGAEEAAAQDSPENPLGWTLYLQFSEPGGVLGRLLGRLSSKPGSVSVREILDRLTYDWRWNRNRPDIYGRKAGAPWIHLAECAETEDFSELAVTWSLIDDRQGWQIPTAATLDRFRQEIEEELEPLGAKVVAQPVSSQYAAEEVPKQFQDASRTLLIVVQAPDDRDFDGRDIWDVMLSLGLEWGDMDLFHWNNPKDVGDDRLFSVWTTTDPGYFLPEVIAAGELTTTDLVFEMSIPRCPAAEPVFESMLKAAAYAQERLGGILVDRKRQPFDQAAARAELQEGIACLRRLGIEPGSDRALKLF